VWTAGQPHIRLFSCTDAPFTTADVDAEVKLNDEYGEYIVGGSFGNAVLTYYDNFADANAGTNAVALATIVGRFAGNAATNDPQTENVWVTQTDPNTLCESAPTALRLRMRARPEPVSNGRPIRSVSEAAALISGVRRLSLTLSHRTTEM
jgi:hypothetical protein